MDSYDQLRLIFREMAKAVVEEGSAVMNVIITEEGVEAYLIPIDVWDEGDEDEQI